MKPLISNSNLFCIVLLACCGILAWGYIDLQYTYQQEKELLSARNRQNDIIDSVWNDYKASIPPDTISPRYFLVVYHAQKKNTDYDVRGNLWLRTNGNFVSNKEIIENVLQDDRTMTNISVSFIYEFKNGTDYAISKITPK